MNEIEIKVVIGSWGSYNACNQRALGSEWLTLADYDDWDEIAEELERQGFDLKGIDSELFIQDIEGIPSDTTSWDYTHPQKLFNILQDSGVLTDIHKYEVMLAFLEVRSFDEFQERVQKHGDDWDMDICIHQGSSWEDYGKEVFDCNCNRLDEHLQDFFDFEAYGRYMGDCAEEYSDGIIEIY